MIFKIISAVKIRVKTWKEEKEIQKKSLKKYVSLWDCSSINMGL